MKGTKEKANGIDPPPRIDEQTRDAREADRLSLSIWSSVWDNCFLSTVLVLIYVYMTADYPAIKIVKSPWDLAHNKIIAHDWFDRSGSKGLKVCLFYFSE